MKVEKIEPKTVTYKMTMDKCDEDYLLNKMSNRNKFFVQKSKQETIKTIEENGWNYFGIESAEEWEVIKEEINDIDACASEETFFREVDRIVPDIDFESIELVKDYPQGAYVAIGLFIKYIQPLLKEEWRKSKEI